MAMISEYRQPDAREAEENLRVIRELMERSTKHSTFSGFSGVMAGTVSMLGCVVTHALERQRLPLNTFRASFLITWLLVVTSAIGMDYFLTKRDARKVGKSILSRLGKQMLRASAPGLGTGALLTILLLQHNLLSAVYPVWMLCYGIAVCAVGLFSQKEVSYLGTAFLLTGAVTLLLPGTGLAMAAVAFGGFHIFYGIAVARKDGW